MPKSLFPIMEQFLSFQGEGHFQGTRAYFIRLAGCDVGCVWCDVKDSWDSARHPVKSAEEILVQTQKDLQGTRITELILTGGEPFMYDINPLSRLLQESHYRIHIETSGAYPPTGTWDWLCVSPKKFRPPHRSSLRKANEYKVVIYHPSDLLWMEQFLPDLPSDCHYYLQPEWSRQKQILPSLLDYMSMHPEWHLSLQTHNYVGLP
ncbi:MAG: 7-carboxy-7-deazaguanine synthase QueE [Cytophagales bacterium]|nr:7-carboxy-7-deazaguanine synthase QueE [Cytophagales bacterium]